MQETDTLYGARPWPKPGPSPGLLTPHPLLHEYIEIYPPLYLKHEQHLCSPFMFLGWICLDPILGMALILSWV